MSSVLVAGFAGLVLGLRHAFEPDHLAAVGSMVPTNTSPRRAAKIGAVWGSGHAVALFVFGALIFALRLSLPGWLDAALEGFVGLMLIALGFKAMAGCLKEGANPHTHSSPFAVGVVHGLAGTGAAVLLATATLNDDRLSLVFLGLFGLGATAGMSAVAALLGIPTKNASFGQRIRRWAPVALGACSVIVGVWWFLKAIGLLEG